MPSNQINGLDTSINGLMNMVFTETARPDMIAETQQAVLASILRLHGMEVFYKDVQNGLMVFDTSQYIQEIETYNIPRFRSMYAIRKWDPNYLQYQENNDLLPPLFGNILGIPINPDLALAFLEPVSVDDVLDRSYKSEKVDIYYAAGDTLYMKSSTKFQQALIYWLSWPYVNLGTDPPVTARSTSWIANEFPYAVVYDAASAILQKIGMTDASRKYDSLPDPRTGKGGGLVQQQVDNLLMNNITIKAR